MKNEEIEKNYKKMKQKGKKEEKTQHIEKKEPFFYINGKIRKWKKENKNKV